LDFNLNQIISKVEFDPKTQVKEEKS